MIYFAGQINFKREYSFAAEQAGYELNVGLDGGGWSNKSNE